MAKRKNRKRPVSPGVTLGRDLRQPEIGLTSYQGDHSDMPYGNWNDPHAALPTVKENLPLRRFFANQAAVDAWSQPVRPIK